MPMKKGIWFVFTACVAMTMVSAIRAYIARGLKPRVLALDSHNHENKNFNPFPIEISERDFDD